MKKSLFGLVVVLLALGLVLVGCSGPFEALDRSVVAGARAANNGNGNNKVTNNYLEGAELKQDFNNAQFHCNAISGNGRVWPVIPADMKKFDGQLTFTKAEGTRWNLTGVAAQNLDSKGKAIKDSYTPLQMVVCPECGSIEWITFSNNSGEPDGKNIQMQHPGQNLIIEKDWIKHNFPYPLTFKFVSNFALVMNGKTYKLGPGQYFIPEDLSASVEEISCSPGFALAGVSVNGEEVALGKVEGLVGGDKVKFINEDQLPPPVKGKIRFEKIVEGELISAWIKGGVITDYLTGFNLYYANDKGEQGAFKEYQALGSDCSVLFENLENGWYAVEEVKGPKFAEAFVDKGLRYFQVVNGVPFGMSSDFDYDAEYVVLNGYGSGLTLGYPGLNNTGDIFPIHVKNTVTGDVYASFCANAGSQNFSSGYYTVNRNLDYGMAPLADFIAAYNYINNNVGDLDEYRTVTQIVTWYLLGAIEIPSDAFDNIKWDEVAAGRWDVTGLPDAKAIVEDVVLNYSSYAEKGDIVDVVFLTDPNDNSNRIQAQPQLVPVKGKPVFKNIELPPPEKFSVSFTKTAYDGQMPGAGFAFNLFNADTGALVGTYISDSNGIVKADNLPAGNYVFKEVLKTYYPNDIDNAWKFVWAAVYPGIDKDGLYFTIGSNGVVNFPDGNTVNNKLYCKTYLLWDSLDQPWMDRDEAGEGWLYYPNGRVAPYYCYIAEYHEPTCTSGGWIYFQSEKYPDQRFDIPTGEPALGHHWELNTFADGLRCSECGIDIGWWDLSPELYDLYHALGGLGTW